MDEIKLKTEAGTAQGPALPVDSVRLQEFDQTLRRYKAGKAHLERRVIQSEQWWKLRNDSAERREMDVAWDQDFQSRSGWLHNVLVSKHADAMENYPEAMVLPREPNDKTQAETLSSIIPCILEQCDFEDTYSNAWWRKLKTGTAVFKCAWDPDALNGLGEIRISDVDLLSLFWEPGVRDIQDSRYFFHVELHDNDLLEQQYPQLQDKLKGNTITLAKFIYDDNVSTDGKSVVVDVYYKQGGVLHYCKYVGDQVLYSTENEEYTSSAAFAAPAEPGTSHAPRASGSPQGEGFGAPGIGDVPGMAGIGDMQGGMPDVGSGTSSVPFGDSFPVRGEGTEPGMPEPMQPEPMQPEHRGLYNDGLYPFVFDPLFPIEGSPCGYGYVDLCKNPQTAIDILRTAFVKNVKVGATPRFFARSDGAVNEQEFLDLNKPMVHVNGNLDEQFLRPIDTPSLPGNYVSVFESMVSELRQTSGNTESANGIYSGGVTAASSIAALQEASGKTSRDASRASYRAFKRLINMVIERIRQFYDLPRQFRITGKYGQEQFVTFDNAMMRPKPIGIGSTDMGFTQPVFDIRVEVQKRNAYTRTSQNELALQLYQLGVFNPMMAQQSLMLLDMMDFDGKEALMQKLQMFTMMNMMPPAPVAGGKADPEALEEDSGEPTFMRNVRDRANQAAST